MTTVRHLEILKFGIVVTWPVSETRLLLLTKFCVSLTIYCSDVAKKRFSTCRPSAILNLLNFDSLSLDRLLEQNLHLHINFH